MDEHQTKNQKLQLIKNESGEVRIPAEADGEDLQNREWYDYKL